MLTPATTTRSYLRCTGEQTAETGLAKPQRKTRVFPCPELFGAFCVVTAWYLHATDGTAGFPHAPGVFVTCTVSHTQSTRVNKHEHTIQVWKPTSITQNVHVCFLVAPPFHAAGERSLVVCVETLSHRAGCPRSFRTGISTQKQAVLLVQSTANDLFVRKTALAPEKERESNRQILRTRKVACMQNLGRVPDKHCHRTYLLGQNLPAESEVGPA